MSNGGSENGDDPIPVMDVDRVLERLGSGEVVFDSPQQMEYKKTKEVFVTLYPDEMNVPELSDDQESGEALVSNRMEAVITGEGFSIIATSPSVQAISSIRETMWSWQITPVEPGNLILNISLNAILEIEGTDTPFVVETFSRELKVRVPIGVKVTTFLGDNWKWLWTAIFIPIGGYAIKKWRSK